MLPQISALARPPVTEGPTDREELVSSQALLTVAISPRFEFSGALTHLIREALPTGKFFSETSAAKALSRAETVRIFGAKTAIFIFDFRGQPVRELAAEVQRVRRAHPAAELLVVIDGSESQAFAACLQVVGSPFGLTFLLAPLQRQYAVEALRAAANRYRSLASSECALEDSSNLIEELERRNHDLNARLDFARHTARHDQLTGVLNRTGFVEELTSRLSRGRQPQTLLIIDLDRFKAVNDTLGHDAGDELVRKISVAMAGVVPAGGVLARLGGDEFGIIVEAATREGIASLCAQVLQVCAQTRMISGHEVQVSASVGVANQDVDHSESELMRRADLALYAAKREGRNRHRIFDATLDEVTKHRLSIENGLERGLRSGQFSMVYQPIVGAEHSQVLGYEALVRWDSPEHGSISPAEFIPIAEETGLILDIGDWIARQALKDCRRWNLPYVSINISVRQFLRHNVGEHILRYAADADVSPQRIQIELTETAIIDDVERAAYNLKVLRAAGVRVALDDFGTGYSSLVYLNQFAIDCIKIDKSFVDNVTCDRQSAVIVASVAKLAASLGMSVVAEGVETKAQRQALIACGCGALQGYYFGRPVPPRELGGHLILHRT
jgi:diguanylate cyclase (GGDEF)-like protein